MDLNDTIIDYITGHEVDNTGAEANRQAVERFLVEQKGFLKKDILVDTQICFEIEDKTYRSCIDLVITINDIWFMVIKCAAGSLGSREKEVLAGARLLRNEYQIPFCLVSDGKDALIYDTITGRQINKGLETVFSKPKSLEMLPKLSLLPLPEKRKIKEKLIFRSYDSMNVNVQRKGTFSLSK